MNLTYWTIFLVSINFNWIRCGDFKCPRTDVFNRRHPKSLG